MSPIPAGVLEIPLLLTFSVEEKKYHEIMKEFVGNLDDNNYCAQKACNDQIVGDIGKQELRVTNCELRVTNSKVQVQSKSLNWWFTSLTLRVRNSYWRVTSFNQRVTSWNPRVQELFDQSKLK